ncbi:MAG TPA: hypothetical protein VFZ25_06765 [Chloroflexota bacterium]|nr:hypothetical protein [Chloroflexota bacterium]
MTERVLAREPAATTAFLAAYARGDLAQADELASALYRAEWLRRGLSLEDRQSLLPAYLKGSGHPTVWLRFQYVGGMVDARGFGHLLYAAEATGGDGDRSPSVWRVDTDADGRVIWLEMVGLLAPSPALVTTIAPTSNPSAMPEPSRPGSPRPCLLLGVRSSAGHEGYYEAGLKPDDPTGADGCPARVTFFVVDEDGLVGPGAWTFGQSRPGLVTYGHVVSRPTSRLPASEESLRSAYIASLP